jgi:hypothetical protein
VWQVWHCTKTFQNSDFKMVGWLSVGEGIHNEKVLGHRSAWFILTFALSYVEDFGLFNKKFGVLLMGRSRRPKTHYQLLFHTVWLFKYQTQCNNKETKKLICMITSWKLRSQTCGNSQRTHLGYRCISTPAEYRFPLVVLVVWSWRGLMLLLHARIKQLPFKNVSCLIFVW